MKCYYKILCSFLIAAGAFFLLGAGIQEDVSYETRIGEVAPEPNPEQEALAYTTATEILSYTLLDWDRTPIGQTKDIVIDYTAGFAPYIVFSLDGESSARNRYPIPVSAMKVENDSFIINIKDTEVIKNAPRFSADGEQGLFSSVTFQENIYNYWLRTERGLTPGYISPQAARHWFSAGMRIMPGAMVLFTHTAGASVFIGRENELGTVDELIMSPKTGDILCSTVRISSSISNIESNPLPLPLNTFTYEAIDKRLFFDPTVESLKGAPGLPEGSSENITEYNWQQNLVEYWNAVDVTIALRSGARVTPGVRIRASRIVDLPVLNSYGQQLGKVEDLVVERNGTIPFAMVEFDTTVIGSDNWYFVPLSALTLDKLRRSTILDLTISEAGTIPEVEAGNLPDTSKPDWDKEILEYWDTFLTISERNIGIMEKAERTEEPAESGQPSAALLSTIKTFEVVNTQGSNVADLNDLLIDIINAKLAYFVMETGNRDLIPVPLNKTNLNIPLEGITIESSTKRLENAPRLQKFEWDRIKTSEHVKKIDTYWNSK